MAKPRPRPARPRAARRRTPREPRPPARREEVIEAALALVSERGVAGASLRRLASRLGMSQPSLYHYFASKDALIRQIIDHCGSHMLGAGQSTALPKTREGLPRFAKEAVLALYANDTHPRFVRFLFLVAIESPRHRPLIEQLFEERLNPSFGLLAEGYGGEPGEREVLRQVLRMIVYSVGFMLLDERALRGHATPSADTLGYAEWAMRAGEQLLAQHAARPGEPPR
jgi:AcrR family transcriptional regulator